MLVTIFIVLVFVNALISYANARHRLEFLAMLKWLQEQHKILDQEPDFKTESNSIIDEYMPTIQGWFNFSATFGFWGILFAQGFLYMGVVSWIFSIETYYYNTFVAAAQSAVFVYLYNLYQQYHTARGMCEGVDANVKASIIMKQLEEEEPDVNIKERDQDIHRECEP